MSKFKFALPLTEEQKESLADLANGDEIARTRKRAEAIQLSCKGYTIDQISAIMDKHRNTVGRWIDQWEERGLEGLLENEGQGRPQTLTEEEQGRIIEWLKEEPRRTKPLVERIGEEFGKKVCAETVKRVVRRHGMVWKRARASLSEKRDEEEFRECKQELAGLMEEARRGEIDLVYLDEAGFGRNPCIPYMWQPTGETARLPCREGKRINIMGLYSFTQGTLKYKMASRSMTGADLVDFLDEFSRILTKPTVVPLDNASIHTAKIVAAKIEEWEGRNLYLYYIPAYSPELNLIEIVWRKIKYDWLPLRAFESFKRLGEDLTHVVQGIGYKYKVVFS